MVCIILDSSMMTTAMGSCFLEFFALSVIFVLLYITFFFQHNQSDTDQRSFSNTRNCEKVAHFDDNSKAEYDDYDPYEHRDVAHPIT